MKRAPLSGRYSCPGSVQVGNREKRNFEGRGIAGSIDLRIALAKSCDTIFYGFAQADWYDDEGRIDGGQKPQEALQRYARAYGFGSKPGLDVPVGEHLADQLASLREEVGRELGLGDREAVAVLLDDRRGLDLEVTREAGIRA